jgi:hypothetical protein
MSKMFHDGSAAEMPNLYIAKRTRLLLQTRMICHSDYSDLGAITPRMFALCSGTPREQLWPIYCWCTNGK